MTLLPQISTPHYISSRIGESWVILPKVQSVRWRIHGYLVTMTSGLVRLSGMCGVASASVQVSAPRESWPWFTFDTRRSTLPPFSRIHPVQCGVVGTAIYHVALYSYLWDHPFLVSSRFPPLPNILSRPTELPCSFCEANKQRQPNTGTSIARTHGSPPCPHLDCLPLTAADIA